MVSEVQLALRNAAGRVAQYVEDAATMTVETRYVQVTATGDVSFEAAKPVARTTVRLDGDCEAVVPVQVGANGRFELDGPLLELHQRNVDTAIEYRARILNALLAALPALPGRGRPG